MPKQILTLNNFSGGINNLKDPRDLNVNELANAVDVMIDKQGVIRTRGGETGYESTVNDRAATVAPGHGLAIFESDFALEQSGFITDRSSNNDVDFIDKDIIELATINDEADKYPVGSMISVTGTAKNNGFKTVYDSGSDADSSQIKVKPYIVAETNQGAIIKRHLIGETLVALADAATGTVDVWQRSVGHATNGWATAPINLRTDGTDTLLASEDSEIAYYFVDNAIRVCDTNFNNSSVIKHYGYVERNHFENTTSANALINDMYHGFYENLNSLAPPTEGKVNTTIGAGSSGDYLTVAGAGFNVSISEASDDESTWAADTYEIAISFVYDENQESLLFVPADNDFTVTEAYKQTIIIRVEGPYDERISGGRAYFRSQGENDEPWVLLADVNFRRGARASLSADYVRRTESDVADDTGWAGADDSTGAALPALYSQSINSFSPNLDTYESINGYPPTVDSNSIGGINEGWKTAVVANRRAFLAHVRLKSTDTGRPTVYGDRIMYSMPNKFDTFPSFNFIDVVKGDAENYIKLESYADRLLAFKQKSVQIINISSPSDTNWFLEDNIKHNGVQHPSAVVRTDYGICWVNENGCYIYDGSKITNLIDNKIVETSSANAMFPPAWNDFIYTAGLVGKSVVAYEKRRKQLIVMKDCGGSDHTGTNYGGVAANGSISSGDAYIYDFKTRAWVFADNAFTDQKKYTNFVTDWNGDLIFGYYDGSTNVETRYWSNDDANQAKINITTRDIDFGDPSHLKKIYKIYATYKSSADQLTPLEYSVDGKDSWSDFATGSSVSPAGGDSGDLDAVTSWDVATFTPSSPISCQSIQLKFNPPDTGTFEVNDISIEYRALHKRVS
jgi:hypothetical protein